MTIATGTPPVIDITQLGSVGAGRGSNACVESIHAACVDTGFFVIVGHGTGNRAR